MNSLTVGENAPLWTFAGRRRFCSSISLLMNKPTNSFNLVVKEIESRAELRRHFVRGHVIKLLACLLASRKWGPAPSEVLSARPESIRCSKRPSGGDLLDLGDSCRRWLTWENLHHGRVPLGESWRHGSVSRSALWPMNECFFHNNESTSLGQFDEKVRQIVQMAWICYFGFSREEADRFKIQTVRVAHVVSRQGGAQGTCKSEIIQTVSISNIDWHCKRSNYAATCAW